MKIKILTFITILLIIVFSLCAIAKKNSPVSQNVERMIQYAQQGESDKAITIYKTLKDSELNEFVKYLENNPGKLAPIYFVMVSDQVYKHNKDKAVFFYNFGKIRAMEDVRMCKDSSARQQTAMYAWIAPNTVKYMRTKSADYQYIQKLFDKVIEWDDKYSERVSPMWACYHGVLAFSKEPELLPESEFDKIKQECHENLRHASEIIHQLNDEKEK